MRWSFKAMAAIFAMSGLSAMGQEDPYLWLEDVGGDKALGWVREQNSVSTKRIEAVPTFAATRDKLLAILDSKERIPFAVKRGDWLYNFWTDEKNPRGVWRRTTLDEYKKAEPRWETMLDIDALGKAESVNWVWKGSTCVYPTYDRCLISLSRGGADAVEIREFDIASKSFVKDGFFVKEAKGSASWIDRDQLYVATDFGPNTMTKSGYPRQTKLWKRGEPLAAAKLVFEGKEADVSVSANAITQKGFPTVHMVRRGVTFFTAEQFFLEDGNLVKIDIPEDANAGVFRDWMSVTLRKPWEINGKTYAAGTLLAIPLKDFRAGKRDFRVLFQPSERTSLAGASATRNYLFINVLDNVKNRLYEVRLDDPTLKPREVVLPGLGTAGVQPLDPDEGDEYFLTHSDFLTPVTQYFAKAGTDQREKLKALPAFFDATPYEAVQHEAKSKDGTMVPYFVLRARNAQLDGKNPTVLYGYGGFQISQAPSYAATAGAAWLQHGGVYVISNIRGGGEFGPRWHQAALKENRQKAFDDYIAIAEDLIARKITSPKHLGIYGGSNGGLLTGAVMVQRPDLFGAVVSAVPLLDMKRYNKMLAGASWVAEYGNPDDPKEWEFISKYSPYQNVKADVKYPATFFTTSTRDDRVHPGHARKMMARMSEMKQPVYYYENIEGGHGGAADNKQRAYQQALVFSFFLKELSGRE